MLNPILDSNKNNSLIFQMSLHAYLYSVLSNKPCNDVSLTLQIMIAQLLRQYVELLQIGGLFQYGCHTIR